MKTQRIVKMAQLAVLIAIVLVMSFTPIGYLRTGGLEISLLSIPVAIGAMLLGPAAGALLGGVFGVTSFFQCFGMSPFGAVLLSINPVFTFLVCVPTRILMGWLTGMIFRPLAKLDRTHTVSYFIGGLLAALLNTLLFMSVLLLCFWNTDYIQSLNTAGNNVLVFAAVFVGINGVLEWPAGCIISGVVAKAVDASLRKARLLPPIA